MNPEHATLIAPAGRSSMTSGRLLARNTLLSIAGEAAPLALGLVAIPILVHGLGVDRYGVLSLSYIIVGYFSLFDLGLGRAATQQISDAIGAAETDRIPAIFWTSMILMFLLGLCGAAIIAGMSHWLVYGLLNIPTPLRPESVSVFLGLGAALPFVLSASCAIGTLASFQRFDLTTTVGAVTGAYSFTAPLAVLIFTHSLVWVVAVIIAGRIAAWVVGVILCLRVVPALGTNVQCSRGVLRPLMSFGGWITLSGITSPLMVSFDRFVIGSMLSIAAVAYYTVPYQIVNKLSILPGAISGVLFPAFSATARLDSFRAALLFERSSRYALLALFPGVLVLFLFSREILILFFSVTFADHASSVMRCLLIGVFVNGLALIPYGLVQAANRPDLTAKFHVAETPIYFFALFLLLPNYGVAGAAIAWSIRVILDAAALFGAVAILFPETRAAVYRIAYLVAIAAAVVVCGGELSGVQGRVVYSAISFALYAILGWNRLLDTAERVMLVQKLHGFRLKDLARKQPA